MEVLEPARGGYQVTFFVLADDGQIWYDPELGNNSVQLRVGGQAMDAVPVGGMLALFVLSLSVVAAGLRMLAMRGPVFLASREPH